MRQGSWEGPITPEAVRLRADAAGVGSRSIALMVDLVIQAVMLVPILLGFLLDGLAGMAETAVFSLFVLTVVWGYFPLFEWLRGGQTPGKRVQGIRVVRTSGEPAGFAPVMVRNLLRIIEVYALPFVALIAMFVTARSQRLGDLAAGTMVVRDRAMPLPAPTAMAPPDAGATALDTSALTEPEYAVLRTFLARRDGLDPAARQRLAAGLAARLRQQVGPMAEPHARLADETLIQAAVRSYRSRYAARADGPSTGESRPTRDG